MMRLTIVVVDDSVGKDGVFYDRLGLTSCQIPSNVWALQWDGTSGHIEFDTPIPNEDIVTLPSWATACLSLWEAKDYAEKNPPPPTPEQAIASNEEKAKELLAESDWTQVADVNLSNQAEWDAYRQALRVIATAPTVDPVWPIKPQVIWAS
jgi:hypothetical protein